MSTSVFVAFVLKKALMRQLSIAAHCHILLTCGGLLAMPIAQPTGYHLLVSKCMKALFPLFCLICMRAVDGHQ